MSKHIIEGIPFYSQYIDINNKNYKSNACGILSLAMVINFYLGNRIKNLDEFYEEGRDIGGFQDKVGWRHSALVEIANKYGCAAHNEIYKGESIEEENRLQEEQIQKFISYLLKGTPVIISVWKNKDIKASHLVLLVGVELDEGAPSIWHIYDTDIKTKDKNNIQINHTDLMKKIRPFGIFVSRSK